MDFIGLFNITTISISLMIIGALGIILVKKPLDKVIMFDILDAGFILAVVTFKYLDVAFAIAILGPISTIVFLMSVLKINEVRIKNQEGDSNV